MQAKNRQVVGFKNLWFSEKKSKFSCINFTWFNVKFQSLYLRNKSGIEFKSLPIENIPDITCKCYLFESKA